MMSGIDKKPLLRGDERAIMAHPSDLMIFSSWERKLMAIKATPSCEYPFILVPENHPAFRDHASAKRELKRQWAGQEPSDRICYFLAKVEHFVEPDYGIEVHQEPVCPPDDEDTEAEGQS